MTNDNDEKSRRLAPLGSSTTTSKTKTPQAMKDRGNQAFSAGKYQEACICYSTAIQLMEQKENYLVDDFEKMYLLAVCVSNKSNCLFEMGQYEACRQDADKCMKLISEQESCLLQNDDKNHATKLKTLACKNLLRKARALFYLEFWGEACEALNKLMSDPYAQENTTYVKRARRMLQQVSYYLNENRQRKELISDGPPPRLLRSGLVNPIVEYYKYGHDSLMSALDNHEVDGKNEMKESSVEVRLEATPNLSILFAGINDGRHVLYTAMHMLEQYKQLQKKQ